MIVKLPQTQLPKDRNQTRKKNTKQKHTVNYLLPANAHSGNWLFQALEPILGFLKLNLSSFEQPLENQPNIKYNPNYKINLILKISFSKKKKCLDTVYHAFVITKLNYDGIRGNVNEWFKSYLSQREQ